MPRRADIFEMGLSSASIPSMPNSEDAKVIGIAWTRVENRIREIEDLLEIPVPLGDV